MKKEEAAPQNGTTQLMQRNIITKYELVAIHLLEQGIHGVSALSGMASLQDLNLRNSISALRCHYGLIILDEFFSYQHSLGGVSRLKRYWLADRDEAQLVAELVNDLREARNAQPMSQGSIANLLSRVPPPMTTQVAGY